MKSDVGIVIAGLALLALFATIIIALMVFIGAINITDDCLLRYGVNGDGELVDGDTTTHRINLKSTANYSDESGGVFDNTRYGEWLNTNVRVDDSQTFEFKIQGELSLCRAYVPRYNLTGASHLDSSGSRIPIPRVDEPSGSNVPSVPVNMSFDAKSGEWRNLTQVYPNDHVVVGVYKDRKGQSVVPYSSPVNNVASANCADGRRTYSPLCGRYSTYNINTEHVTTCNWDTRCNCVWHCYISNALGDDINQFVNSASECSLNSSDPILQAIIDLANAFGALGDPVATEQCTPCWQTITDSQIAPYSSNNIRTHAFTTNYANLTAQPETSCDSLADPNNIPIYKFWLSADGTGEGSTLDPGAGPTGLITRGSPGENSPSRTDLGGVALATEFTTDQIRAGTNYRIILDSQDGITETSPYYLQYRIYDINEQHADNTGGYVLNIRQTKCRRSNGQIISDDFVNRGAVEYVVMPFGQNANDAASLSPNQIITNNDGVGSFQASSTEQGYLWLRIKNADADYPDSIGEYQIDFTSTTPATDVSASFINPLINGFKDLVGDASKTIFKNMTCYQGAGDADSCTNFFNYLRALLTLYIVITVMMFLLGMVKINQTELITRIIKVVIVAGLMNEGTYEFFNEYIFDIFVNFSDNIIANMSGYTIFSGDVVVSNPLIFMVEIFKRLFSKIFLAQILSLFSMGFPGIIYFVIIFVALGLLLISLFKALAVYFVAFLLITILIGMAPLFITFILFAQTWYLFDNWLKYMFKYMVEPVIVLSGLIILTQLFTIYLDNVLGYSVCWKCAIPIKIPFLGIPGLEDTMVDTPLFCINWFAPWGFDPGNGSEMGMDLTQMVPLLIIAVCIWGWVDFAGTITQALINTPGAPSAASIGSNMAAAIGGAISKQTGLRKAAAKVDGGIDAAKAYVASRAGDAISRKDSSSKKEDKDTKDDDNDDIDPSDSEENSGQSSPKFGNKSGKARAQDTVSSRAKWDASKMDKDSFVSNYRQLQDSKDKMDALDRKRSGMESGQTKAIDRAHQKYSDKYKQAEDKFKEAYGDDYKNDAGFQNNKNSYEDMEKQEQKDRQNDEE